MNRGRALAATVLGLRIAYGAGLVLAPARLAQRWLGSPSQTGPTQVPLRALGAREIALHAAAARALWRGEAVRPWLAASFVGDVSDVVATAAARRELPDGAVPATVVVGGGSALITALVAAGLEA